MTTDKTVTMSRERRPVCHACISRPRDEYCPVCDIDNRHPFMRDYGKGYFSTPDCVKKVFTSPPAPVAVVLPTREAMRDLIAEVVGGDTYDCTRVWSAWGVGTMSEDDFVPLVEQEERLYELADACLDKVKELNQ